MEFRYRVINEEMKLAEGTIEAVDYETARRNILNNEWQLIELLEVNAMDNLLAKTFVSKVKYDSVAAFCSQLAMIIRSGTNLVRGLEILQAQLEDKRLKVAIATIHRSVSAGNTLAMAMKETKGALPDLLVNLVAVGEESGNLDSILESLSKYYERENFIRKKISSAAIYPIMLTLVMIALVIFFMGFILPEISDLFNQNGQSLPLITQIVIKIATFIQTKGWMLIPLFIGLAVLFKQALRSQRVLYYWHLLLLKIPLIGRNMTDVITARFSRTLALFLNSSIPIVTILTSLENIVGNEIPRLVIVKTRERVIKGESLAHAFGEEGFFDTLVVQMMTIGEETGRLEELMVEVANNYDKRVELGISRLVALVEPLFTVLIGGVAGVLIISIALPIFNMSSAMK